MGHLVSQEVQEIKENQLERDVAKALYKSLVKIGFRIDDYLDIVRDVFREAGQERISVSGEDKPVYRLKRQEIIDYAKSLLDKYDFPTEPER